MSLTPCWVVFALAFVVLFPNGARPVRGSVPKTFSLVSVDDGTRSLSPDLPRGVTMFDFPAPFLVCRIFFPAIVLLAFSSLRGTFKGVIG